MFPAGDGRKGLFTVVVWALMVVCALGTLAQLSTPARAVGMPTGIPATAQDEPELTATETPTPAATATCVAGWTLISSPNPGTGGNLLTDVEAVASDDVWAVGAKLDSGSYQTLIEHWDGAQWSTVNSPNASTGDNFLSAIAAITGTGGYPTHELWAVGSYASGDATRTLVMRWDGSQWNVVPSPSVGTYSALNAVAVVSANDAWAVGTIGNQDSQTLIMRWNGSAWNIVPSPTVGTGYVYLTGVAAVAANDVWAVGYSADAAGVFRLTLALHWDGSQWNVVSTPNPGFEQRFLMGVSAAAANDVWAAGFYHPNSGPPYVTLILHWDGSTWTQVPSPNGGTGANYLYGVKAFPSGDAWAVGDFFTGPSYIGPVNTLVERWNGSAWSIIPSPNAPGDNAFNAVDGLSSGDLWAVGSTNANGLIRTLVERYRATCASPTSTPTATPSVTPTTPTNTPTPTMTPCAVGFSDVHPADYFYEAVRYLYCLGVISGYSDGTFRPYNNATRGQMTKIVVLAFGITLYVPPRPTFIDVAPTDPFYQYIETAAHEGIVAGYSDGTFRPYNNVTRGQLCKIVVVAAGWPLLNPPVPTFSDVPPESAFYTYIETAYDRGIISGYADGAFRPGNNATRGQISKITYQAIVNP